MNIQRMSAQYKIYLQSKIDFYLKIRNLEIVFHFHNKCISLIQTRQMKFKWSLVTFFLFSLKRRRNISRYIAL